MNKKFKIIFLLIIGLFKYAWPGHDWLKKHQNLIQATTTTGVIPAFLYAVYYLDQKYLSHPPTEEEYKIQKLETKEKGLETENQQLKERIKQLEILLLNSNQHLDGSVKTTSLKEKLEGNNQEGEHCDFLIWHNNNNYGEKVRINFFEQKYIPYHHKNPRYFIENLKKISNLSFVFFRDKINKINKEKENNIFYPSYI
jgi:hypothetical protein